MPRRLAASSTLPPERVRAESSSPASLAGSAGGLELGQRESLRLCASSRAPIVE